MQIFILPSAYNCDNMGDLAMLQMAVRRLKTLWPQAVIRVLTETPEELKHHCPGVEAVPYLGSKRWWRAGALPRFFFPEIRPEIRRQFPCDWNRFRWLAGLLYPPNGRVARQFAAAVFNSDLLVMSGCGMITDAFASSAIRSLETLALAARCNIPTALLGQGLGPIQDPELFQCAAQTLPQARVIFLRERHASRVLLEQFQVTEEKTIVTGDDAVELAFNEKRPAFGNQIGINLRLADYSALDEGILGIVRPPLIEQTLQHQSRLVGIPIHLHGSSSDVQTLRRLLDDENTGGELDTPLKIIHRIADCRIVVTGSYHAGVFALSQGIPVIGIAKSAYYCDKFNGLAFEFGEGCTVLNTGDPGFPKKLTAAMDDLWARAEILKPKLLAAAERQIHAARAAYARLPELVRR